MTKIQITYSSESNYSTDEIVDLQEDFTSFIEGFDDEADIKTVVVVNVDRNPVKLSEDQRREIARQYIDEMKLMDGIAFVLEVNGAI